MQINQQYTQLFRILNQVFRKADMWLHARKVCHHNL
jgi:hypothetical protein